MKITDNINLFGLPVVAFRLIARITSKQALRRKVESGFHEELC